MNTDEVKRDSIPLPLRWIDNLSAVSGDDFKFMFVSLAEYVRSGKEPDLNGFQLAMWKEMKDRVDYDSEKYQRICQNNRENGKLGAKYGSLGGRPAKPRKTPDGDFKTPKTPEGDGDGDGVGVGVGVGDKECFAEDSGKQEFFQPSPELIAEQRAMFANKPEQKKDEVHVL